MFWTPYIWLMASVASAEPIPSATLALEAAKIEDRSIRYDPAYVKLTYPMGDVSPDTGVCTDVVIRAYRGVGIDLQQLVHEDIVAHPTRYTNIKRPDTNIDHRRVPNLGTFFKHNGTSLPVTENPVDYQPGDIVWWKLGSLSGLNHIGVVVDQKSYGGTPLVIHNIGGGQVIENLLFQHPIVGHYRYLPETKPKP